MTVIDICLYHQSFISHLIYIRSEYDQIMQYVETYFFHSRALYIQEDKYMYMMPLRPDIYHHCYKETPYNHQCLQRKPIKICG